MIGEELNWRNLTREKRKINEGCERGRSTVCLPKTIVSCRAENFT